MKKKFYLSLLFMLGIILFPFGVNASSGDVCKIGDTGYTNIEDAIKAAKDKDEIVLIRGEENINIPSGKNISINLNKTTLHHLTNEGTVIIKNGSFGFSNQIVNNKENASLVMENITFETFKAEEGTDDYAIENEGKLVLKQTNLVDKQYYVLSLIGNGPKANLIIESGNYEATNILMNFGTAIINGGNFTGYLAEDHDVISSGIYNTNKLTINNGTFTNIGLYNYQENLILNGGKYTDIEMANVDNIEDILYGKGKEWFISKDKAIIQINKGEYLVDRIGNRCSDKNGMINITGGTINSYTSGFILTNSPKSIIAITGGTINAKESQGIALEENSKLIIGKDDNKVSKDLPIINIPAGEFISRSLEGNAVKSNFEFYDGKVITKNNKMDANITVKIPKAFEIKYDKKEKTYEMYLTKKYVDDTKEKNPNTFDKNIVFYLSLIIVSMLILGISIKKVKVVK